MVDIKDFGFVIDYALYDELPYYATGYIAGDCDSYVPPNGYVVLECEPSETMIIGGSSRSDLNKIKVGLYSMVNTTSIFAVVGIGAVILTSIGLIAYYLKSAPKKRVITYK